MLTSLLRTCSQPA